MDVMNTSNTDCYFFYYSTCEKGDDCPYRHCVEALGRKEVCNVWLKRRDCTRKNCPKRHMDTTRDRGSMPCYYENQKGGCRKPHCAYKHSKSREYLKEAIDRKDDSVILPVKNMCMEKRSNENADTCRRNGGSLRELEYDASSESSEELDSEANIVDKPLLKCLVQKIGEVQLQENKANQRQTRHRLTSASDNSRPEMNLQSRTGRKEIGARSASCHSGRIRTPKSTPANASVQRHEVFGSGLQINGRKQKTNGRSLLPEASARPYVQNGSLDSSQDILWQFDSSKISRKPKKKREEKYDDELTLDFDLGTRQKFKYFPHERKKK